VSIRLWASERSLFRCSWSFVTSSKRSSRAQGGCWLLLANVVPIFFAPSFVRLSLKIYQLKHLHQPQIDRSHDFRQTYLVRGAGLTIKPICKGEVGVWCNGRPVVPSNPIEFWIEAPAEAIFGSTKPALSQIQGKGPMVRRTSISGRTITRESMIHEVFCYSAY
jgi:hypothetical protein